MTPTDRVQDDGVVVAEGPLFVDTNVFLRFLTNDVPEKATAVEALFRRAAAGHVSLVTNVMVLAELVWVLESYYRLGRCDVQERVLAIVCMDGLFIPDADVVLDALPAYASTGIDFVDAYNCCWLKHRGLERVVTFDVKHYSQIEGILVQSP